MGDLDEKVDNVTKLGNNMYFYTGPGGQDSPPPLTSDDEELDLDLPVNSQKTEKEAARKSNRAGKGRNPRLEREDEEVEMPKKLPPKPNLNPNWLKAAAKTTEKEKKTPTKKKVAAQEPQGSGIAVPIFPLLQAQCLRARLRKRLLWKWTSPCHPEKRETSPRPKTKSCLNSTQT